MLNFKRYFAIIAVSFVAFSCQNVRERFSPTPLQPYVNKLSVKFNGDPIATATTVTAFADSTKITISAGFGANNAKSIVLSIDRNEGVGNYVKTIDGVLYKLTYTESTPASTINLTARPAGSVINAGYLDTKLNVIKGEFECRLPNGSAEVQLSQGTFDIQYVVK